MGSLLGLDLGLCSLSISIFFTIVQNQILERIFKISVNSSRYHSIYIKQSKILI